MSTAPRRSAQADAEDEKPAPAKKDDPKKDDMIGHPVHIEGAEFVSIGDKEYRVKDGEIVERVK